MTSKEALKKLENATNWSSDENIDKDLYNLWGNVACRIIKKDLEVLNILKNKLDVFVWGEKEFDNIKKYFLMLKGGQGINGEMYLLSKKEYTLLKDWFDE